MRFGLIYYRYGAEIRGASPFPLIDPGAPEVMESMAERATSIPLYLLDTSLQQFGGVTSLVGGDTQRGGRGLQEKTIEEVGREEGDSGQDIDDT
ncbi:hypothetical protein RRG08_018921 [Elysia crispata]|uniref:Uncharacterized protein n=1 Tax=Elysia crispata TaxID=231223 RepID=A0AAE0YNA5_9GAST|nr:hypothetical protein RRG08_018921 [Elysia crispata]